MLIVGRFEVLDSARAWYCLERTEIRTIGDLRHWSESRLIGLEHFGVTSLDNVRWFFHWAEKLETNAGSKLNVRSFLKEFLNRSELRVMEQRFGLTDPLFRPQMKRRTLAEIAGEVRGGLTRERVRQIEEAGFNALRARLPVAVIQTLQAYWESQVRKSGCILTSAELGQYVGDTTLGGYQPWGALLLLSEVLGRLTFRHDYFTTLTPRC